MNNWGSDQDVELTFSGGNTTQQYWQGTIPKNTVVTWLLPSTQVLGQTNGTNAASQLPPYPYANSTSLAGTGTAGETGTAGSFGGTCPATISSSSSSGASSSSSTVIPVPDTTHTIASRPTTITTTVTTTYG